MSHVFESSFQSVKPWTEAHRVGWKQDGPQAKKNSECSLSSLTAVQLRDHTLSSISFCASDFSSTKYLPIAERIK